MWNKLLYKYLPAAILLWQWQPAFAQPVVFNSWSNNYLQVNSYSGNTANNAFTLSLAGNGVINIPAWKISVRLKQAVLAPNGQVFPADMINLQPTSTTGQAYPDGIPGLSQIGVPPRVALQENTELFLVPRSNAPLYNNPSQPNGYYELQLLYNLVVTGGAYLGRFPAWSTLNVPLEFKVYDGNNNLIGIREHNFQLQIAALSGTPPSELQYSIQVAPAAQNGLLEFKTAGDYINGVTATYPNALVINANTSYQVRVKSVQTDFVAAGGATLPLNTVMVQLRTTSAAAVLSPIWLSQAFQKIASATDGGSSPAYYDIIYATKPNDPSITEAGMLTYTTTLQYEITPQ